mmetsp:Transcript_22150/g.42371  ORF Transcript_22150/g.42371 Transcript_22150/m.42371 type:complete len:237 (-) Transcript_22150:178-888(-)
MNSKMTTASLPKDGSHNHPSTSTSARKTSLPSTPNESHPLRDGSHNHPAPNTMSLIQSRLDEHNLTLPPPGAPKANYQLIHRDGNVLYLSGHLPIRADGSMVIGCCAPPSVIEAAGEGITKYLTTEEGYEGAKHCALNLLSTLQSYLSEHVTVAEGGKRRAGDLSDIAKVVKLFGIVRSHDDFVEQHLVMNGASDVLGKVLGKDVGGMHARSAIGTNSLPLGICVEVELIVRLKDL